LETAAHPQSYDWRYKLCTDGQETCGGNVAEELKKLNEAIARRRGEKPKPRKDKVPPPRKVPRVVIPCTPQKWKRYYVEVKTRPGHDWITRVKATYTERELPDGRCSVRLEILRRNVAYWGKYDPNGNVLPRYAIDRVGTRQVLQATSSDGRAAVAKISARAEAIKAKGHETTDPCKAEIEEHVRRNVVE
jgi:hypothetical protein